MISVSVKHSCILNKDFGFRVCKILMVADIFSFLLLSYNIARTIHWEVKYRTGVCLPSVSPVRICYFSFAFVLIFQATRA